MVEESSNPQPETPKPEGQAAVPPPPAAAAAPKPAPAPAAVPAAAPAAAVAPRPPAKPALPPWPHDEKVLCYPNMIFWELVICMGTLIFIWVWSLWMNAPLEEMANPNLTPNPSRAPWYFLGLQELLVYFDPWIAGVLLPQFIVQGLILLPYVDTNPRQQGYYSYKGREVEFWVMTTGFFMWFILIMIGSTCRGPSWQWYWPWESWLNNKPAAALSWNISDLGSVLSDAATRDKGPLRYFMLSHFEWGLKFPRLLGGTFGLGELIGLATIGGYFAIGMGLPMKLWPKWVERKGFFKYQMIMSHLLVMGAIPIKMALRLIFNIKYVLHLVTPFGSINF